MLRRLLIYAAPRASSALSRDSPRSVTTTLCTRKLVAISRGNQLFLARSMGSVASTMGRDLTYDDIVKLSSKNEIILIDVREPAEIQETGKLPGSTHIPLGDVPNALNLDAAAFKEKYGIEKPAQDAPLVFSCRSGKRSNTALDKALALGFANSRHYAGGWLDWEKHTKQ
ncbi:rhodanese domain-containing protein CG4456 isoform X3 [Frankliniella occidentalis]|uniref:Rhodanese domain-containing protein CG4456 isoform X3 n=1 Tax=Frankliniella occidentalis TaxID=133901 RepID=A0A6J1T496_FRAOC|nr:rhodanese domain-containing protein CG4456 isoform X3 [Frankliniella occidentalis]